MDDDKKFWNVIFTIAAAVYLFGFALPRFIDEVWGTSEEREAKAQAERVEQQTASGQQHLREGRWLEAKEQFTEAQQINSQHVPAIVGLAQAVFQLEGADAALAVLGECSDDDCQQERSTLHTHVFNKMLSEGVHSDNAKILWDHGVQASLGFTCMVEKIFLRPQSSLGADERAKVSKVISTVLEEQQQKTEEAAFSSAAQASATGNSAEAQLLSAQLGQIQSAIPIGQAIEMGGKRGAALPVDSESSPCAKIGVHWREDSRVWERSTQIDLTMTNPDGSGDPLADIARRMARDRHKSEYNDALYRLYDLRSASGFLGVINKRCPSGCNKDRL